jgi:hypothetical protein
MATQAKVRNPALERYRRFKLRQSVVRFGPGYEAATMLGETSRAIGGAGSLPAPQLGRWINAHSWPEKVAGAFALYSGVFELHDQPIYHPDAMLHPLAYHGMYSHLPWPTTEGTFALASELGLDRWHPRVWDDEADAWYIGCWVNDYLLYRRDGGGRPYMLFWEVKDKPKKHGQPGGGHARRLNAKTSEAVRARNTVCAAYAEQLGSRIVEFSSSDLPYQLQKTLVSLCRAQAADVDLPDTMVADLIQAFQEAVGTDIAANDVAARIVKTGEQFAMAKDLLDVAVWQRRVRVELYQPLLWNRPLLPESSDVLVDFAHLLAPA